jgi:hypothetical protein
MIWLSLALNYSGLLAFTVTMKAHRHAFPAASIHNHPTRLRVIGIALQVFALFTAMIGQSIAGGMVFWTVGCATCGFVLSWVLSLRPQTWPGPIIALTLVAMGSLIA